MSMRTVYFTAFVVIMMMLGYVAYLETYQGFHPCPLCLLQRYVLCGLGILFLIGSMWDWPKLFRQLLALLSLVTAGFGIFLAGRQVWLQHTPNAIHADCGASLEYMLRALPLKDVLTNVLKGSTECTQIGWQFLSLSLAEWSAITFSLAFILSLWQLLRQPDF